MRFLRQKATVAPLAALVAAALAVAPFDTPVAGAEPTPAPAPAAAHQVRYTLTAGGAADFDLYYVTTAPPDKKTYDANPYAYLKKDAVNVGPGTPWTFETTLTDPQWAILTVSSTTHGLQAAPNPHCEIAVDGQVVNQQDGPYNLQCQLRAW